MSKVQTQNQPNQIEHLKYAKSLIFFFSIMHILEKFSLKLVYTFLTLTLHSCLIWTFDIRLNSFI